jgi:hypothetical protein
MFRHNSADGYETKLSPNPQKPRIFVDHYLDSNKPRILIDDHMDSDKLFRSFKLSG